MGNDDVLVIIGNGPSLKQEYFDIIKKCGVHTVGMNAAYRFYNQMNWWPTYFCCFDYALTETHKEAWSKMVLNPAIPIKKYCFIDVKKAKKESLYPNLIFSEQVRNSEKFIGKRNNQEFIGYPKYGVEKKISSTGANAVRFGIELGYKRFLLIGHDCKYKQCEKIKEAKQVDGWKYRMAENLENNPNYFWKNYQVKGDLFNKPGDQLPAWKCLKECVAEFAPDVKIYNCSKGSRIHFWKIIDFKYAMEKLKFI